jgi:hypothetical protein
MLTPKALAQLRRDLDAARTHLAFLERMAADDAAAHLHPTPAMLAERRQEVADLERRLLDHAEQLELFT